MERIEEPEINRRIILLYLERYEILHEEARREILKTISLLNNPVLVVKS